jgi:hypothetical protein
LEQRLAGGGELTEEMSKALETIKESIADPGKLYDYKKCLAVGDVWIHLECLAANVKDLGTTNYKESQILCPALGLEMRLPSDPTP